MKQFTVKYVQNLKIRSLVESLLLSEQKWNWLSKEKAAVLKKLYEDDKIGIDADDCPSCKYKRERNFFCNSCPLDVFVCDESYDTASRAFHWFFNGKDTITNFRKEAKKVRNAIKRIRLAIEGK